jgi:hypothetical protein
VSLAAGYSGTPLPRKLGFKPGQTAVFVNLPADLAWLAQAEAFAGVEQIDTVEQMQRARFPGPAGPGPAGADLIHAFFVHAAELRLALPALRDAIRPSGAIWISWPKKASKVPTDIIEDTIRDHALAIGLVDVKVCAVTEVWSGLKLVIPVAKRVQPA